MNEVNLWELAVDTTEELNNTYFYAGRPNLTTGELFFMIFCEEVAEQLGIDDFGAIVAILSGRNVLTTRTKPRDALKGTSYASRAARRVFPNAKFPFGIQLPTIVGGYPPRTARILFTHKLSTFVGRAIPVVGWVILARDVADISFNSVRLYNAIARGEDKLW
ncbi:Putative phage related protein (plasmid) [Pantoea agglomerans]|uniref:Phage related protein n=1 Tax=Enterobacter agglomerans TaxID=549 RepID=A0AAN2FHI0_ENTAG|nr:Putative phage related protein [Pantoea agglomerans]